MITRLRILQGLGQVHPAAEGLSMHPGKVAVSEHMAPESQEGFVTVDDIESDGLTDLGTVIASADEAFPVGTVVIMRPLYGKYVRNFRSTVLMEPTDEEEAEGIEGLVPRKVSFPLVRFFGCCGDVLQPADEVLIGTIEGRIIRPSGTRALVALDKFDEQTTGGLYIPERAQHTNGRLTVLDIGPRHTAAKPGDRCVYSGHGLLSVPVPQEMAEKYPDFDPKNICFIEETHLLATVTD